MKDVKARKILKLDPKEGYQLVDAPPQAGTKQKKVFVLIQASEIGFSIALPIVLGALFGLWLDNRFGTAPRLTLSLMMVGVFFGFTVLYLVVRDFSKRGK